MTTMERWEPLTVTTWEVLRPGPVAALAALFDDGLAAPGPGDPMPRLWHWVALGRWPVSAEAGADGRDGRRGAFLPPVGLPRRTFAGGEVVFHGDLRVGDTVRRESAVESVTERSGGRVVVAVLTRLFGEDGGLRVDERQDLVYREAGAPAAADVPVAPRPVTRPLRRTGAWTWEFSTDPALLMRFAAAASNAHRIPYDWPYAASAEDWPGLVMHGPLLTLALAETLRLERRAAGVTLLRHRTRAPLLCGRPARLRGRRTAHGVAVDLFGPEGEAAAPRTSLTAELRHGGHLL